MGAYQLAETAVNLVQSQIKSQITTALFNVRTLRADSKVTLEDPKEYFTFAQPAHVYRAPAVFTIIKSQDIRDDQQRANHINSMHDMYVAVVVQDRIQANLVTKSWRYQAALMQCLHQQTLTSSDSAVRLFVRVQRCEFTGIINLKDPNSNENVFRKEVSLKLQVEHIENLE